MFFLTPDAISHHKKPCLTWSSFPVPVFVAPWAWRATAGWVSWEAGPGETWWAGSSWRSGRRTLVEWAEGSLGSKFVSHVTLHSLRKNCFPSILLLTPPHSGHRMCVVSAPSQSLSPARGPTMWLNSDAVYLLRIRAQCYKTAPSTPFQCQLQVQVAARASDLPAISQRFPQTPPQFW